MRNAENETRKEKVMKTRNGRELNVGTLIYYTGDMANQPDFGIVEKINPADRFGGPSVNVKLEDGRTHRGLPVLAFNPGPGRRFMTADEYHEERRAKIEQFKAWAEARKA